MVGALNDRLLLASPTEINPRQKKGVEVKSCLVGLLEPLLIGFATMQQNFQQKLDLSEILYQITSRFPSLLPNNLLLEKIFLMEKVLDFKVPFVDQKKVPFHISLCMLKLVTTDTANFYLNEGLTACA